MHWGDRHSAGPDCPPLRVRHKTRGADVSDRRTRGACGEVLTARDAEAVPGPGAAHEGHFSPFASR